MQRQSRKKHTKRLGDTAHDTCHDWDGQQAQQTTSTYTRRLTSRSLSDTAFPCPGYIKNSVAEGRDETPEPESDSGAGDSGGCETSKRLAQRQWEA